MSEFYKNLNLVLTKALTMPGDIILSLSCPDRPGIVATVGTNLFGAGCNVLEAHQYNDPETKLFFMRVRFAILSDNTLEALSAEFANTAEQFGMSWSMRSNDETEARDCHGFEIRSLSGRPVVPTADRRDENDHRRNHRQSSEGNVQPSRF
jgi:predicted amino acid-binding ACT domain protein